MPGSHRHFGSTALSAWSQLRWYDALWLGGLLLFLTLLHSCGLFDFRKNSETFRYKLTINVRVDGQMHSASSVIEATQKRANCPWWGFSGSHSGGSCLPNFTVRGVAPMIRLDDGAVIFASLSGYHSDNPPGVRGEGLARLPWFVYVPDWGSVVDRSGPNWTIIPLPKKTPRLEIPFEGHWLSKFRPPIWWVPAQKLGPAVGTPISSASASNVSGRRIGVESFVIEQTNEKLVECLTNGPPWVAAYHGGPTVPQSVMDERRYNPDRPIDRKMGIGRFETCNVSN